MFVTVCVHYCVTTLTSGRCDADDNGIGGATAQDIFDLPFDWNRVVGGLPTAIGNPHFSNLDGVTTQDNFDFLAAWNAGCQ
jgi:hypothetical protein